MSDRIPEDVDALMWVIADKQDHTAAEDLLGRLPNFRSEMYRRMDSVKHLRASAPMPVEVVPPFVLKPARLSLPTVPVAVAAGVVLVSAIGFALLRSRSSSPSTTNVPVDQSIVRPSGAGVEPRDIVTDKHERPNLQREDASQAETHANLGTTPSTGSNEPKVQPSMKAIVKKVSLTNMPLDFVMRLVAEDSGLRLDVQGGQMPNPNVTVHYQNTPALVIFQDLGRKYGFAAFEDKPGTITLVPTNKDTEIKPLPDGSGDLSGPIGNQ